MKPILAAGKITKNACYKNNIGHIENVTHFTADPAKAACRRATFPRNRRLNVSDVITTWDILGVAPTPTPQFKLS